MTNEQNLPVNLVPQRFLTTVTQLILGVVVAEIKRNKMTNTNRNFNRSQRISVMSAIIISVFLIIEIPLMVITMLHALGPKVT